MGKVADRLEIGQDLGEFRITGFLGMGAMGAVYRAQQARLKRDVAIKVLHPDRNYNPEFRSRFRREAQAAARLSHPGIVPVFDNGESEGRPWFAMELVEGETLHKLIRDDPVAIRRRSDPIITQLLEALAAVHDADLIHRDVKTGNLMVRPDGRLVLMDFSLVKDLSTDGSFLTKSGNLIGTPAYLSPETLGGKAPGPAADVWAVGCVYYALFTGGTPFQRPSIPEIIHAIGSDPLPDFQQRCPGLDAARRSFLARLLARDPADRFPDAAQALEAFRRLDPLPASTVFTSDEPPSPAAAEPSTLKTRPAHASTWIRGRSRPMKILPVLGFVTALTLAFGGLKPSPPTWTRATAWTVVPPPHGPFLIDGNPVDQARLRDLFFEHLTAARQGRTLSRYAVGILYARGLGIDVDPDQGLAWLELAAGSGFGPACQELAERLRLEAREEELIDRIQTLDSQALAWGNEHAGSHARLMRWMGELLHARARHDPENEADHMSAAAEWLERAVDDGDTGALALLGEQLRIGAGTERDEKRAIELFERGMAAGDPVAHARMGRMYQTGKGWYKDPARSRALFEQAFSRGYACAGWMLAQVHRLGLGADPDPTAAASWSQRSAREGLGCARVGPGCLEAMRSMARRPIENPEGHEDRVRAWYRQGALAGDGESAAFLGHRLVWGTRGPVVAQEGVIWLMKASARGQAQALVDLGGLYATGHIFPKDPAAAFKHFHRAAERGNVTGMVEVGRCYESGLGVPRDLGQAGAWYRRALGDTDPAAHVALGLLLLNPEYPEPDQAEALRLIRQAAEWQNGPALAALGVIYGKGLGVEIDRGRALTYIHLARQRRDPRIQTTLDALDPDGSLVPPPGFVPDPNHRLKGWTEDPASSGYIGMVISAPPGFEMEDEGFLIH